MRHIMWLGIGLAIIGLAGCAPSDQLPLIITATSPPPSDTPTATVRPTATIEPTFTPLPASASDLLSLMFSREEVGEGFLVEPDISGVLSLDQVARTYEGTLARELNERGVLQAYQISYRRTISVLRSWAVRFADDTTASEFMAFYPAYFPNTGIRAVNIDDLAEESAAFRNTAETEEGRDVTIYQVLIRVRNVVAAVYYLTPSESVDLDELEAYATILATKMQVRLLGELLPTPTRRPTSTPDRTLTVTATTTATPEEAATEMALTPSLPPDAVCDCRSDRYNCSSFSSRRDALSCYEYCIDQGVGDVHRLDPDQTGNICPGLP